MSLCETGPQKDWKNSYFGLCSVPVGPCPVLRVKGRKCERVQGSLGRTDPSTPGNERCAATLGAGDGVPAIVTEP